MRDGSFRVWDAKAPNLGLVDVATVKLSDDDSRASPVTAVAATRDGKLCATGCQSGEVRVRTMPRGHWCR